MSTYHSTHLPILHNYTCTHYPLFMVSVKKGVELENGSEFRKLPKYFRVFLSHEGEIFSIDRGGRSEIKFEILN